MYHPRNSIYTKPPKRPYISHPLDYIVHQAYAIPRSYNPQPRVVPPRLTPDLFKLPAPKPDLLPDLPLYIDSSMLSAWRSCKRKHYWSTINALYPTGQSVHLVAGAAIAAGLEAARRYVFSSPNPAEVSHSAILEACYPAYSSEWGTYQPPEDNPRNAKTYVNCWAALANYLEEFHPAFDPIQPLIRSDGSPTVEYRFAIPLPVLHPSGDPFILVGRFDLLGNYTFGGQQFLVVADEKTTSSFTYDWANKWDLRGQFLGYIWALRQQGLSISHAVVRGIAIQKTQFDNRTAFIHYPDHLISQWYQELIRDLEQIKTLYLAACEKIERNDLEARHEYAMNFADACDSYGGCAFRTLCCARDPQDFISNYTHYRWDPLALKPVSEQPSQEP